MQDVRYHTIQWVHRTTRGWSYGGSGTDPRTGEIIKGHVTLGSLRVRQDYLIAEGLLAPYETGQPANPEMERLALARLHQLSAHEVGHTLGLAHNYLASVARHASVMDYPHPFARLLPNRRLDLSDACAAGIGEWDKVAIQAGYTQFPPGTDEVAAIDRLLRAARGHGLHYLTDQDARPAGFAASRELFERRTGPTFDALAPAEAAASLVFPLIFHPQRANRLLQQHTRDPQLPGLEEVITRVLAATWRRPAGVDLDGEIQRVVNLAALGQLFRLGADEASGPQVQAVVAHGLDRLRDSRPSTDLPFVQAAHFAHARRLIERFLEKPQEFRPPPSPAIPPGQPIGCDL